MSSVRLLVWLCADHVTVAWTRWVMNSCCISFRAQNAFLGFVSFVIALSWHINMRIFAQEFEIELDLQTCVCKLLTMFRKQSPYWKSSDTARLIVIYYRQRNYCTVLLMLVMFLLCSSPLSRQVPNERCGVNALPRRIRAPFSMARVILARVFQKRFFRLATDSRRKLRSGCLVSALYVQLEQSWEKTQVRKK